MFLVLFAFNFSPYYVQLGFPVCFLIDFLGFSVFDFDLHGVIGGHQWELPDLRLSSFSPPQRWVLPPHVLAYPPNQYLNVSARFGNHLHFFRHHLCLCCRTSVAVNVTVIVAVTVTTAVDVTVAAAVSVTVAAAVTANVTVSSMATKGLPICCLNNHLGLYMWVMVGFGDFIEGYLSVITSHIWEIRRSYFIQDSGCLLLRIPLLASYGEVCNNRRVRVLHELMDQTNTSLFRVLCPKLEFCALRVLIWDPNSLSFRYWCRHRRFYRQRRRRLHHQRRLQRRHQYFCYRYSHVYDDKGFTNLFPRRGNLVESVGRGGAFQSLLISLVFVDLFLVFQDNSSQSFRWIPFPIYSEGRSTCTPVQKTRVVAIKKGRPFPRIVGARWYLFMSYPEAFKTTQLGLHMWEIVRFEDLGYSLCSLYLPPKAVSSFLNSDSLVIFSYLATVIQLGDSLPLLSCLLIYLQVTDGSTTTYKTTLQNFSVTGYLELGCLIGLYSVLSTIYISRDYFLAFRLVCFTCSSYSVLQDFLVIRSRSSTTDNLMMFGLDDDGVWFHQYGVIPFCLKGSYKCSIVCISIMSGHFFKWLVAIIFVSLATFQWYSFLIIWRSFSWIRSGLPYMASSLTLVTTRSIRCFTLVGFDAVSFVLGCIIPIVVLNYVMLLS